MKNIFENLLVVELANVLAGPNVGQFFAELGAEVIKIESDNGIGDVTRSWKTATENKADSVSSYFACTNFGKKSVCLNFHKQEDTNFLYKIISKADIVVASYKVGDAEKLGVDYQTLSTINPQIIYGQITGYGYENPRAGYDAIIQAESGFMYLNREADNIPQKMPVALIDVLAAHQLKEAILVALLRRKETGKGQLVSVSLFEAGVSALVNMAAAYLCTGISPEPIGSEHPAIVPYGKIFTTADSKQIILAVGSDVQFSKLCKTIGIENISKDEKFSSNVCRVNNRLELNEILSKRIAEFSAEELLNLLHKENVPAGKINKINEVFEDPLAKKNILAGKIFDKEIKAVRSAVFNSSLGDFSLQLSPPPLLGQHTQEIKNNCGK